MNCTLRMPPICAVIFDEWQGCRPWITERISSDYALLNQISNPMLLRSLFGLYLSRWCSGDSPHLRQREPREIQVRYGKRAGEPETNHRADRQRMERDAARSCTRPDGGEAKGKSQPAQGAIQVQLRFNSGSTPIWMSAERKIHERCMEGDTGTERDLTYKSLETNAP